MSQILLKSGTAKIAYSHLTTLDTAANNLEKVGKDVYLKYFSQLKHNFKTKSLQIFCENNLDPRIVVSRLKNGEIRHGLVTSLKKSNGIIFLNMNPRGEIIGDCSTRSLTYFLNYHGIKISYDQVRKAQDQTKIECGFKRWNCWYNICQVAIKHRVAARDWVLKKSITRSKFAKALKDIGISSAVISQSRGHAAIIQNGLVIDTWDSRRGRINSFIAALEEKDIEKLKLSGLVYYF